MKTFAESQGNISVTSRFQLSRVNNRKSTGSLRERRLACHTYRHCIKCLGSPMSWMTRERLELIGYFGLKRSNKDTFGFMNPKCVNRLRAVLKGISVVSQRVRLMCEEIPNWGSLIPLCWKLRALVWRWQTIDHNQGETGIQTHIIGSWNTKGRNSAQRIIAGPPVPYLLPEWALTDLCQSCVVSPNTLGGTGMTDGAERAHVSARMW